MSACPFERGMPTKIAFTQGDLLWTPKGMTAEQALQKLPHACHRILTVAPNEWTLQWLQHLYDTNMHVKNHSTAAMIAQCIDTGRQMLVAEEVRPTGCDRSAKRMRH